MARPHKHGKVATNEGTTMVGMSDEGLTVAGMRGQEQEQGKGEGEEKGPSGKQG